MTKKQAELVTIFVVAAMISIVVAAITSVFKGGGVEAMPLPELNFAAIAQLQGSNGTYGVVGWVSPTPPPTPTNTPAPTATPVIIATPAPALIPTDEPTNTPAPTDTPVVVYVYPTAVATEAPAPLPTDTPAPAWEFTAVSMMYYTEDNYPAIRAAVYENGNPAPGRWLVVYHDGVEVGRAESVNSMAQAGTGTAWTDDDYPYNAEVKFYEYNPQTWVGVWAVELRNGASIPVSDSTVFTLQQDRQEVSLEFRK